MENAGRSAALLLQSMHPEGIVVAAVGPGNNGGDALVLLRTLRAWGREVRWLPTGAREPEAALAHGFELPRVEEQADSAFAAAGVIVDGMLGTGARGAPRGGVPAIIAALNGSGRPVLALDLPSGVDPDTGEIPGESEGRPAAAAAVRADVTVCFGWPKRGLLRPPGRARCGRIMAVEIGFPPSGDAASAQAITPAWALERLPARAFGTHKYEAGSVLVVAGRSGMGGAAVLAARSAMRAGAGLVRVASSEANRLLIQEAVPDALFVPREDGEAFGRAAASADAVVAGPGMGTSAEDGEALRALLEATPGVPTVLDADALTLLGAEGGAVAAAAAGRPLVLTPHPGEFGRIWSGGSAAAKADPVQAAREFAAEIGGTLLLKGAPSVVARDGAPVLVDAGGSSDFAKAGMGDHLAGLVGGLLAQGAEPRDAAGVALGVSSLAALWIGAGRGLSPADLAEAIAPVMVAEPPRQPEPAFPFVLFDQAPPR